METKDILQEQINRLGLTRLEFSRLAKITKTRMNEIFNGSSPLRHEYIKMAFTLGCNIEFLFGDKDIVPEEIPIEKEIFEYVEFNKKEQIEKPGKKKKPAKIQNKTTRLHDIEPPKEKHCRWCNVETGTENFRHSEDPEVKFLSGGGITGGKINDNHTAWGCADCDLEMSTKPFKKHNEDPISFKIRYLEWQNKWRLGVIKTHLC